MTVEEGPTPWLADFEGLVATTADEQHCPSISWGIVADGGLAMSGSTGAVTNGQPPSPNTVYRIASMTKSFSAAAVLSLRDEGLLALDDDIVFHAPELARVVGPTIDNGPIRVRHLLSMASGLATDDAWADRHVDITDDELDEVVARGPLFAMTTGTAFEYSNLGYGLLGRVVKRVSGQRLQDVVTERFLQPLGMDRTTWVEPQHLDWARPFVEEEGSFRPDELAALGDGEIAPMGGLWTTVTDLARWMTWLDDANIARNDNEDGPLLRASRREMQQMHRYSGLLQARDRTVASGYGLGLRVIDDPQLGRVITHSGGLPGYGSNMRWIAGRGLGVIAMANVTYAPMSALTSRLLDVVASGDLAPVVASPVAPLIDQLGRELIDLLANWTDDAANALFSDNVGLDVSFARRHAEAQRLLARCSGHLAIREIKSETNTSGSVYVRDPANSENTFKIDFQLSPLADPAIQLYEISEVGD